MFFKTVQNSSKLLRNFRQILCTRATFCSKIQEQTVNVNGQTINYVKTGQGNKTLLCFPGALGTIWSDFKPQITDLDKSVFTVVAFDPPGYGRSRPPSRNFNPKFYENDADTAYNFMSQIGITKFTPLGWSDGGIASIIMAAKYPSAIENLVIWGANSYILPEEIESYEKIRDISKWSDKMKAPLIELYTEEGLQKMWNDWNDAVIQIYEQNKGDICTECLKKIKCPTLILHGDKDPMVAAEHPMFLASTIYDAKLYNFPKGKHNIHLRYAEEFNQVVTDFLVPKD